ncbi:hypothetical protein [Kineococcus sp. SYSU DK004]|uniref:hypothetical protein n=1 Tax=Kineococcus sp. SYSU DK004 TaxID=3383125 RepID=UPI003D7E4FE6
MDEQRAPGGLPARGTTTVDADGLSLADDAAHGDAGPGDLEVLRWDAPAWASRGLEVEGGWLHTFEARVVPLEGDEGAERPCPVRLESADLAYAEAGQTVLRRFGPRVYVGDIAQLSLPEAQRLVAALTEVIERAATAER